MSLDEVHAARFKRPASPVRGGRLKRPKGATKKPHVERVPQNEPTPNPENKKLKITNPVDDVDEVVKRVELWIQRNPNSRPRTKDRLSHSISKFCYVYHQLDAELLFYKMLNANLVTVSTDKRVHKTHDNPHCEQYLSSMQITDSAEARDFLSTLRKMQSWLQTQYQNLSPKSVPLFKTMLEPFCTVKVTLDPAQVLNMLEANGKIEVDLQKKIKYNIEAAKK
jgi:hypothetical protein